MHLHFASRSVGDNPCELEDISEIEAMARRGITRDVINRTIERYAGGRAECVGTQQQRKHSPRRRRRPPRARASTRWLQQHR